MVGYVDSHLIDGENVVFRTRTHWIIYLSTYSLLTLLIGPYLARRTNEFAVTNKRILIKEGIIRRRSVEIFVSKVESVAVRQSLSGRILGFGHLTIVGTGGTQERFLTISRPLKFRRHFQEVVNGSFTS